MTMAEDKREEQTTCLEYLDILLDSNALKVRLLQDILHALNGWSSCSTCSKQEQLYLIGTISLASKGIPAGKSFLRSQTAALTCRTWQPVAALSELECPLQQLLQASHERFGPPTLVPLLQIF